MTWRCLKSISLMRHCWLWLDPFTLSRDGQVESEFGVGDDDEKGFPVFVYLELSPKEIEEKITCYLLRLLILWQWLTRRHY